MSIDINFTNSSFEQNVANTVEILSANVLKQGDTYNELRVRLMHPNGVVVNLDGATVLWSAASSAGKVVTDRSADVRTGGEVAVKFEETDQGAFGTMRIEFRVTYPNGAVEKFPANDHVRLLVTRSLEDLANAPVLYASVSYFTEKVIEAADSAAAAKISAKNAENRAVYVESQGQTALEQAELAEAERLLTAAEREATEAVRLETLAVKNANKTKWLPAVATVALRNSTYPNPANGDTVRVTGESTIYRFDTVSGWVKTDEYNPTAIDSVTAQLAETETEVAKKADISEVQILETRKADKVYVDSKVQAANLAWKSSFATLADLQATYPIGDSFNHVVRSDGMIYNSVNGVWTSTQVQANGTGIANRTVSPEKTTFIEISTNLVDINALKPGFTLSGTTGEEVANALHGVSDFRPIAPSTTYYSANIARRAFYDSNEVFISSTVGNGAFTTPANVGFIKVVIHNTNQSNAQLNVGSTLLPYEPGHPPRLSREIEIEGASEAELEEVRTLAEGTSNEVESLKTEGLEPKLNSVGVDHLKFVKRSTNLFNVADVTDGYAIDTTTGELTPNSANSISGFIPVKGNTDYSRAFVNRIAYYDANRNFISSSTNPAAIRTPVNAAYTRLIASTSALGNTQFNEGAVLFPYEPYYVRLEGVSVVESSTDILFANHFVQKLERTEEYTAPILPDRSVTSPDNLKELLYSDINALYSELAINYPHYVTETLLGTEATGRNIYRYDFTPPKADEMGVELPKVFITAGTHGSEKTAVWVTYQMVKQLCEAWGSNETLDNLRWNVHLIIIPVLNPWGWDYITEGSGNRTGTRKNSNGVDIARNFPTGWTLGSDPLSATFGGTSPLSEPEAQYANAILEAEKDGLIYVCDFHNFFTRNGSIWNAAATNFQINLGEHLVRHMSRKWKKEHDFVPQDETTMVGYSDKGAPNASLGKHVTTYGIHGGTFEVAEYNAWEAGGTGAGNSPLAIKFGMEAFINWLGLVVKNAVNQ